MIHLRVIIMNDIYPELCNWYNLDLQDNTKTLNILCNWQLRQINLNKYKKEQAQTIFPNVLEKV